MDASIVLKMSDFKKGQEIKVKEYKNCIKFLPTMYGFKKIFPDLESCQNRGKYLATYLRIFVHVYNLCRKYSLEVA